MPRLRDWASLAFRPHQCERSGASSGEITNNIAGVAQAVQGTTRGATDTQKASQQLVEMSAQLRSLVG